MMPNVNHMHRCRFCGIKSNDSYLYRSLGKDRYECIAELRCFERLLHQRKAAAIRLKRVLMAGGLMSNLCFNLSQQTGRILSPDMVKTMDDLRRQWDEAQKEVA